MRLHSRVTSGHCTFSSSESANAASTQLVRMYRSALWRASAAEGLSFAAIRGFEGASELGATMISGPGLSPVSSWRRPESVWRHTLSYHSPPHNHTHAHCDSSLLSSTLPFETRTDTGFRYYDNAAIACRHWRVSSNTDSSTGRVRRLNVCWTAIIIRPAMLSFWETNSAERPTETAEEIRPRTTHVKFLSRSLYMRGTRWYIKIKALNGVKEVARGALCHRGYLTTRRGRSIGTAFLQKEGEKIY